MPTNTNMAEQPRTPVQQKKQAKETPTKRAVGYFKQTWRRFKKQPLMAAAAQPHHDNRFTCSSPPPIHRRAMACMDRTQLLDLVNDYGLEIVPSNESGASASSLRSDYTGFAPTIDDAYLRHVDDRQQQQLSREGGDDDDADSISTADMSIISYPSSMKDADNSVAGAAAAHRTNSDLQLQGSSKKHMPKPSITSFKSKSSSSSTKRRSSSRNSDDWAMEYECLNSRFERLSASPEPSGPDDEWSCVSVDGGGACCPNGASASASQQLPPSKRRKLSVEVEVEAQQQQQPFVLEPFKVHPRYAGFGEQDPNRSRSLYWSTCS